MSGINSDGERVLFAGLDTEDLARTVKCGNIAIQRQRSGKCARVPFTNEHPATRENCNGAFIPIGTKVTNFEEKNQGSDKKPKMVRSPLEAATIVEAVANQFRGRLLRLPGSTLEGVVFGEDGTPVRTQALRDWNELYSFVSLVSGSPLWFTNDAAGFARFQALYMGLLGAVEERVARRRGVSYPKAANVLYDGVWIASESSNDFEFLRKWLDFFAFASPEDKAIGAAMALTPALWPFRHGAHFARPALCVGTTDAQGSGKTTFVHKVRGLYDDFSPIPGPNGGGKPAWIELQKNLCSPSGMDRKTVLFDNVTKPIDGDDFSVLVTDPTISARPAYGHDVVSRVSDFVVWITTNMPGTGNDASSRFVTMKLRKPTPDVNWSSRVDAFVREHREQLNRDIYDLLEAVDNGKIPSRHRDATRFPEWDELALSAGVFLGGVDFDAVERKLAQYETGANVEASACEDASFELAEFLDKRWKATDNGGKWGSVYIPDRVLKALLGCSVAFSDESRDVLMSGKRLAVAPKIRQGILPIFRKCDDPNESRKQIGGVRDRMFIADNFAEVDGEVKWPAKREADPEWVLTCDPVPHGDYTPHNFHFKRV